MVWSTCKRGRSAIAPKSASFYLGVDVPLFARTLGVCLQVGIAAVACAQATGNAPVVIENIAYTQDSTGTYRADLYQPTTPGIHPALVMIHGGSWRSGHKSQLRRLSRDLAADGYACFSIDYDTHPHSFPYSWQESRDAVAFLRRQAVAYHIDPDRIAVLGTSAGGQLAALVALAPTGPDTVPHASPAVPTSAAGTGPSPAESTGGQAPGAVPVAAAVLFNGGYDLHPRAYLLRRYLGGSCDHIPGVCNDASPDNHVHAGAPPIYVGHGTHDRLIPYSQATDFISLLRAEGDPVTPYIAKGAGHSYWRSRHWYQDNLKATEAFLAQALPKTS